VSPALVRLRFGVTVCGLGVAAAAVVQLLVFGFVHFTDVRFTKLQPAAEQQQLSVVRSSPMDRGGVSPLVEREERPPIETADVNLVRTGWDLGLERLSGLAVTTGVVAMLALTVLSMLGVVLASSSGVSGVERAVSATTWAVVLAFLSLPLDHLIGASPFAGVFGGYERMVSSSSSVNAGASSAGSLFASYLVLPLVSIVAVGLVVMRFREGVEQGIVIESLSEYDELVEREIASIRARGVGSNVGGRVPSMPGAGGNGSRPAGAQANGTRGALDRPKRLNEPSAGDPLKRPI